MDVIDALLLFLALGVPALLCVALGVCIGLRLKSKESQQLQSHEPEQQRYSEYWRLSGPRHKWHTSECFKVANRTDKLSLQICISCENALKLGFCQLCLPSKKDD